MSDVQCTKFKKIITRDSDNNLIIGKVPSANQNKILLKTVPIKRNLTNSKSDTIPVKKSKYQVSL